MTAAQEPDPVEALLDRAHALGADRRVTNYGGGNVSCKVASIDAVTGEPVTVLWVKGSGGDLGTLTRGGLSVLILDRVLKLRDRYEEGVDEDAIVSLFDQCLCGHGGAAPSIATATHALVGATHVDHLHPDAVIAIATSVDGEALTKECFGDEVAWIP